MTPPLPGVLTPWRQGVWRVCILIYKNEANGSSSTGESSAMGIKGKKHWRRVAWGWSLGEQLNDSKAKQGVEAVDSQGRLGLLNSCHSGNARPEESPGGPCRIEGWGIWKLEKCFTVFLSCSRTFPFRPVKKKAIEPLAPLAKEEKKDLLSKFPSISKLGHRCGKKKLKHKPSCLHCSHPVSWQMAHD